MSGDGCWTNSADGRAVAAHHNELWRAIWGREQWGDPRAYDAAMRDSLRRLAEQGYGQSEVAVMFGLSRERIRQLATRHGCIDEFKVLGSGTKPRVWDPDRGMFIAMTWADLKAQKAERRAREKRLAQSRARRDRRAAAVLGLRELHARLGRTPRLTPDIVEHFGVDYQGMALLFWGRYSWRRNNQGGIPWASLTRRWFRVAGVGLPRGSGPAGHLDQSENALLRYYRQRREARGQMTAALPYGSTEEEARMTDEALRVLTVLEAEKDSRIEAVRTYPHPHHFKLHRAAGKADVEVTLATIDQLVRGGLIAVRASGDKADPAAYDRFDYAITDLGRREVARWTVAKQQQRRERAERH